MSRPNSLYGRIQQYETNLIEDVFMSTLIFVTVTTAWSYAPASWPQGIYYFFLVVGLFGFFKYVSPPPSTE
jgi:hypothetical protein